MTKLRIASNLSLPAEAVTSTDVVFGGKGMGKTNLGSVYVEEMSKAKLHWCVLDPMGVWWGLRHSPDGKGPGIECLILGGAHGDIAIEPTAGAVCADLVIDEGVNVVIDFSRKADGKMWGKNERIRFVTDFAIRLFERQGELVDGRRREPIKVILDEAARYIPQMIPSGAIDLAKCVGAWEQVVEEGRNIGMGVGFLTQRSARMNKSVSELADVMYAFRTIGPNSLAAIIDWLGEHVEKARVRELAEQVRKLPVGSALVVSPGWLEVEAIAQIRARETFDSSATPKPGERAKKVSGIAAKPNLAKYRERMAQTIEKAKADDPKALRAEVARLTQLVAVTPTKAIEKPVADQRAIDRAVESALRSSTTTIRELRTALENAMKFIINISTANFDAAGVDPEQLEQAIRAAVTKANGLVEQKLTERARELDALRKEASRIAGRLQTVLARETDDVIIDVSVQKNEPFTVSPRSASKPVSPARVSVVGGLSDDNISPSAQKLLNAAARLQAVNIHEPMRAQLAAVAGISSTSSTTDAAFGQLVKLGYIENTNGGSVRMTQYGSTRAAPVESPPTLREYHNEWRSMLQGSELKLLDAYLSLSRGSSVGRTDLAARASISSASSTTDAAFGKLTGLELLKVAGRGEVTAGRTLFPEGLR